MESLEFFKQFNSQDRCIKYLTKQRWGDKPICPHCDSRKVYKYRNKEKYKCAAKACKKCFNVLTKTIFHATKISLPKWFFAMYLLLSNKSGISSINLSKALRITQPRAWVMLSKIKAMLGRHTPDMLDSVVEVDETFIGGKNKNKRYRDFTDRGRSTKTKTPVIGIIQRSTGKVYLEVVKNTTKRVLQPIVSRIVAKGSTLMTDEWLGYRGITKLGYNHETVNHSRREFVDRGTHTNTIEGFWALFKRGILGNYYHVSRKHLWRYCAEFGWRYNNRNISIPDQIETILSKMCLREYI